MAHAWYYWPMYDEALKKILGMMEMAVKLRCKELGIATHTVRILADGKKKRKSKNLFQLIQQLSNAESAKGLEDKLQHYRDLRNFYAHPKNDSFMGGMGIEKIKDLINLINLIFLDEEVILGAKQQTIHYKKQFKQLKNDLYVFADQKNRLLITEVVPLEAFQVKGKWVLLVMFIPVLVNTFENLNNHGYDEPPTLLLQDIDVRNNHLTAKVFGRKDFIKISPTDDPRNLEKWSTYKKEWEALNSEEQHLYQDHINSAKGKQLRNYQYKYRW